MLYVIVGIIAIGLLGFWSTKHLNIQMIVSLPGSDRIVLKNLKRWSQETQRIVPEILRLWGTGTEKDFPSNEMDRVFNRENKLFDRCVDITRTNYQHCKVRWDFEAKFRKDVPDAVPYYAEFSREDGLLRMHWKEEDDAEEHWKWFCCGSTSQLHDPKVVHMHVYEHLRNTAQ